MKLYHSLHMSVHGYNVCRKVSGVTLKYASTDVSSCCVTFVLKKYDKNFMKLHEMLRYSSHRCAAYGGRLETWASHVTVASHSISILFFVGKLPVPRKRPELFMTVGHTARIPC